MFGSKQKNNSTAEATSRLEDFDYLNPKSIYLDSACQSLRPKSVCAALQEYYTKYNACGGRVKYDWGQKVDEAIDEARGAVLRLLHLSSKDYVTSFTLNTTYGINLLLQQLPQGFYKRVITSDIEHNSVFLPTMTLATRLGVERIVLSRTPTGELTYSSDQLEKAIVVVNSTSNIDGRKLSSIKELVRDAHERGGIVIIDAAQTMAHNHEMLIGCAADAICFSAHKMYAPSLGVIVCRKSLLRSLDYQIVGGGMVSNVTENNFKLASEDPASQLEPGLQAFGEIIAFSQALKWLDEIRPFSEDRSKYINSLGNELFEGLKTLPDVNVINAGPTSVVSLYSSKMDAHRLAIFLSSGGIMARSGYFCCHYYLREKLNLPPLLRFSIGLNNTHQDITTTINTVEKLMRSA